MSDFKFYDNLSRLAFESEQLASMTFALYKAYESAPEDWQSYTSSLYLLSNLLVEQSKALNGLCNVEVDKEHVE